MRVSRMPVVGSGFPGGWDRAFLLRTNLYWVSCAFDCLGVPMSDRGVSWLDLALCMAAVEVGRDADVALEASSVG